MTILVPCLVVRFYNDIELVEVDLWEACLRINANSCFRGDDGTGENTGGVGVGDSCIVLFCLLWLASKTR